MKKIKLLLFFLLFFTVIKAQKVYFIYLQSENQEQFYARLGDKIYNSNPSGYLILSKLVDSTYSIYVGVQGSQTPEQLFSVTINKKDKGYIIKNFEERGWGLFDLQSFAIVMPATSNAINVVKTEKRESNPFTDLLAKASDDSTIKEKPVFAKAEEKKTITPVQNIEKREEVKLQKNDSSVVKTPEAIISESSAVNNSGSNVIEKAEANPQQLKDSALSKTTETKKTDNPVENRKDDLDTKSPEVKTNDVKQAGELNSTNPVVPVTEPKANRNPFVDIYQKSIVVKRSESSTTEGFGITFLDVTGDGSIDTVRILIPAEKSNPVITDPPIAPAEKRDRLKFLDIETNDSLNVTSKVIQNEQSNEEVGRPEVNEKATVRKNNCTQHATGDDFFRIRKNMAAESTDENMISEAKKIFRNRCFSTDQIKNLSTLFLTDEGKYKFFDTAYLFVSDIEKFSSLQAELKEEYYINRFKAMLY